MAAPSSRRSGWRTIRTPGNSSGPRQWRWPTPSCRRRQLRRRPAGSIIDGRMAGEPDDRTTQRPFRALDERTGTSTSRSVPSASSSAPPRADPPARIGHYAIDRKLGQGGMGVVYAARDERLRRVVALKMISSRSGDDQARERFWREARAAASVNHPNVCQNLRNRRGPGQPLHRHGAARRRRPDRAPATGSTHRFGSVAHRLRPSRRALCFARAGHRPPRPQAIERVSHSPV